MPLTINVPHCWVAKSKVTTCPVVISALSCELGTARVFQILGSLQLPPAVVKNLVAGKVVACASLGADTLSLMAYTRQS